MFRLRHILSLIGLAIIVVGPLDAARAEYAVTTRNDIAFVEHDKEKLVGDLYMPQGLEKAPVLIALHGGGWIMGDRKYYLTWGPYLAKNGYAVFSVEYRLNKPGARSYPGAIHDIKAAIQYVRANAASLGVDPDRIGLIGDSSGAHLAALVGLAGEEPLYSSAYRSDPHADMSTKVKAVVGFYGIYDMPAMWQRYQTTRPYENMTEVFLGAPLYVNRKVYYESSPLNYATVDKRGIRFMLVYGKEDNVVDPASQSDAFLLALKQAGIYVRAIAVPGAGHFFVTDPVDQTSYGGVIGPQVLRFLKESGF
ncbi:MULTISPECIES: alpha/beta hydrolase [unclassified Beijerinckia]|uniref:alpha/beta hydrolase n=1 Tax=unclassified Beijerinckia TaxID=2638183 RepID=UPI000894B121|nr:MULTISPECIES: alpha/beta hydrolase [unclassified Beijerinckia]MDH7798929.1 acetyl esterase/lipase [Beijerinckia sp. GAS462]SED86718.1 Acetyl esterase/lipase [Beijerinckia sp. 28-YEA-48]